MGAIPAIFLAVTFGLLAGAAGIVAAALDSRSRVARWVGGAACAVGIGAPILFGISVGAALHPVGYLCLTLPVLPGFLAVALTWRSIPGPTSGHPGAGPGEPAAQRGAASPSDANRSPRFAGCVPAILVLGAMVLLSCVLPELACRVYHGRGPVDVNSFHVEEGMTADEVIAKYGPPHEKYVHDGEETWFYYEDSLGFHSLGVRFDRDRRVTGSWND